MLKDTFMILRTNLIELKNKRLSYKVQKIFQKNDRLFITKDSRELSAWIVFGRSIDYWSWSIRFSIRVILNRGGSNLCMDLDNTQGLWESHWMIDQLLDLELFRSLHRTLEKIWKWGIVNKVAIQNRMVIKVVKQNVLVLRDQHVL